MKQIKRISISNNIKNAAIDIKLGAVYANVKYEKLNKELWKEIDIEIQRVSEIPIEQVKEIPQIASSREAYKAIGKEPARYRLSAEALHRRIINGKGIYQISNIVDIINLSSVKTAYSIGGYDQSNIIGDICFDIGRANEDYEAIGRGKMNIEVKCVVKLNPNSNPTTKGDRLLINAQTKMAMIAIFKA